MVQGDIPGFIDVVHLHREVDPVINLFVGVAVVVLAVTHVHHERVVMEILVVEPSRAFDFELVTVHFERLVVKAVSVELDRVIQRVSIRVRGINLAYDGSPRDIFVDGE